MTEVLTETLYFEFEAARRAIVNLRRKLEECEREYEASAADAILRELARVREHYYDL
jgi:hypothetical protein